MTSIVNVASVPQRSPFRYPGGKTWLAPVVRKWLDSLANRPVEFVEPFAGGASIGLTVAFERLADHVTLIEQDAEVSAVWRAILNGHGSKLAEDILTFKLSPKNVRALLASNPRSLGDKAFRTLVKNRVQHGGIMASGASLMNKGENGKGLSSRWYPGTLARRVLDIVSIRKRIGFLETDGFAYLREKRKADCVWFIDPPYTVAGRRLYTHHQIDHESLFRTARNLRGDFLMTYDDTSEVQAWARQFDLDSEAIAMKSRQHYRKTELIIGCNLDWLRRDDSMPLSSI